MSDRFQSINQLLNFPFSDENNYDIHDLEIANEPGIEEFKHFNKSEVAASVDIITVLVNQQGDVGINTNKVQKSIGKSLLHLSYNENTILYTFTADSPNPRQFVFETVTTNKNGTYEDDDGTNIKFVSMPEDPEKAIEFQLSKNKTDKEDEQPLVKNGSPST